MKRWGTTVVQGGSTHTTGSGQDGGPHDGTVTIRSQGRPLPFRLHLKDHAQLVPGVVAEHRHLDGVFEWIAAQQRERNAARLANPKVTLRQRKRIRGAAPSS